MATETVLVLGGSGFVGRHLVSRLVRAGKRVVVPTRRRESARHLILLPTVDVVEGNIHDPATLARLAAGASAVVNLVGILNESGRDTFARAHTELAQKIVAACRAAGVRRFVQMSALNADPEGPSSVFAQQGRSGGSDRRVGARLDDLPAVGDLRPRGSVPQSVRHARTLSCR